MLERTRNDLGQFSRECKRSTVKMSCLSTIMIDIIDLPLKLSKESCRNMSLKTLSREFEIQFNFYYLYHEVLEVSYMKLKTRTLFVRPLQYKKFLKSLGERDSVFVS